MVRHVHAKARTGRGRRGEGVMSGLYRFEGAVIALLVGFLLWASYGLGGVFANRDAAFNCVNHGKTQLMGGQWYQCKKAEDSPHG